MKLVQVYLHNNAILPAYSSILKPYPSLFVLLQNLPVVLLEDDINIAKYKILIIQKNEFNV